MAKRMSRELEERLSLYLDGRLEGPEREEFERLMQSDDGLREAVEFHRGLARAFHEEAPGLPHDYAPKARARFERARSGGDSTATETGGSREGRPGAAARASRWWRGPLIPLTVGVAAAILAAILTPQIVHRRQLVRAAAPPAPATTPLIAEADKQTLDALRSLGYIGSGEAHPPAPQAGPSAEAKPAPKAEEPAPKRAPAPQSPSASRSRAPARMGATGGPLDVSGSLEEKGQAPARNSLPAVVAPAQGSAESTAPLRQVAKTARLAPEPALPFRIVPLSRGPDPGGDHREIRTAEEWDLFVAEPASRGDAAGRSGFAGSGVSGPAAAPAGAAAGAALKDAGKAVAFDQGEMVIVLRADLESDPPTRLRVVAVRVSAGALMVECRVEPRDRSAPGAAAQGIVVPERPLPVRVVIR